MAKSDDELVVYHSADEFEWYENLDVDRIENGGDDGGTNADRWKL